MINHIDKFIFIINLDNILFNYNIKLIILIEYIYIYISIYKGIETTECDFFWLYWPFCYMPLGILSKWLNFGRVSYPYGQNSSTSVVQA